MFRSTVSERRSPSHRSFLSSLITAHRCSLFFSKAGPAMKAPRDDPRRPRLGDLRQRRSIDEVGFGEIHPFAEPHLKRIVFGQDVGAVVENAALNPPDRLGDPGDRPRGRPTSRM